MVNLLVFMTTVLGLAVVAMIFSVIRNRRFHDLRLNRKSSNPVQRTRVGKRISPYIIRHSMLQTREDNCEKYEAGVNRERDIELFKIWSKQYFGDGLTNGENSR